MAVGESRAPGVFVSYSHRDKDFLERLRVSLQVLEVAGYSVWWTDERLRPGDKWHDEILRQINAAAAALLLLSQDFLASTYINQVELPEILQTHESRGLEVLPIILWPVELSLHPHVKKFQALNDPASPLAGMSDLEKEKFWVKVLAWIRAALARFLGSATDEAAPPAAPVGLPPRNRYFTGREEELGRLREQLTSRRRVGLVGMPGVGKTQIAIEYAHLHRREYRHIFWVNAATTESIVSGYLAMTRALEVARGWPDPGRVVEAVLGRLRAEPGWLLVLDNADELAGVESLIPADGPGHLLLTTREPATRGLQIDPLKVEKMTVPVGARLILRRAGLLADEARLEEARPAHREAACAISGEVDGLPLALDQAGAVIEKNSMSPADYLNRFMIKAGELLSERGDVGGKDHASVTVTFRIAFEKLALACPAAADLLRLCAFLAPGAIPEEILTLGAGRLGSPLGPTVTSEAAYYEMIRAASRNTLIARAPDDRSLSVHRLVQLVVREALPDPEYRTWAERAVQAVSLAFPPVVYLNWPSCDRLLPHALKCVEWAEGDGVRLASPELARLMDQAARYLKARARYDEAEALLRRALRIREAAPGSEAETAQSLNHLAVLLVRRGRLAEAEPLARRALAIRDAVFGPDHLETAESLNDLAELLTRRGWATEAEPLARRALAIREEALGPDHLDTASSRNNLADLLVRCRLLSKAEPLYRRALATREEELGPDHPDTAETLDSLAYLLLCRANLEEAEPLYRRALATREGVLGPDHPDTARSLDNLAYLLAARGDTAEAEAMYRRALAIREGVLGPDHPETARSLDNLAYLLLGRKDLPEAERLYRRALRARETSLGPDHPETAESLDNLAYLLVVKKMDAEAEPLYRRALATRERRAGPDDAETARSLDNLGFLLVRREELVEAEPLYRRALAIREKLVGPEHPDTALSLNNVAHVLIRQGRPSEAEPLVRRARAIHRAAQASRGRASSNPRAVASFPKGLDRDDTRPWSGLLGWLTLRRDRRGGGVRS